MIYFAWINNWTDRRDDDVLKIEVNSQEEAVKYAQGWCKNRGGCSVGYVVDRRTFKKREPGWHTLMWGSEPDNRRTK